MRRTVKKQQFNTPFLDGHYEGGDDKEGEAIKVTSFEPDTRSDSASDATNALLYS